MSTVFVRLLIIYFVTILSIRLMGKRQIGELQMSELVTTFFLSELASYPITNQNIPLTYGIIPVVTLICIEVILSFLSTKVPFFKRLLDFSPSVLVARGKLDQAELSRSRLTIDELLSELRLKDVSGLDEVDYAFLEASGEISIIKKGLGGMTHLLIADGVKNRRGIAGAGITAKQLNDILRRENLSEKEVFLLCLSDSGTITCIRKEKS